MVRSTAEQWIAFYGSKYRRHQAKTQCAAEDAVREEMQDAAVNVVQGATQGPVSGAATQETQADRAVQEMQRAIDENKRKKKEETERKKEEKKQLVEKKREERKAKAAAKARERRAERAKETRAREREKEEQAAQWEKWKPSIEDSRCTA